MTRIGLVLGAGGVAGHAFHAGVLDALEQETGFDPRSAEVVVGTSAGSIVAALLRAGRHGPALLGYLGERLTAESAYTLMPTEAVEAESAAQGAGPGDGRARLGARLARRVPPGRRSVGRIVRMVQHSAGTAWPERSTWICAVRRSDGRRTVFGHPSTGALGRDDLPRAVAASCAIPGWFTPVEIDGEQYVDGGAHSPTNLDLMAGLGLDLVIVSSPMSVARSAAFSPRLDLGPRLLFRATLAREAAQVRRSGTAVVSIQPNGADLSVMGVNAMDGRRALDVTAQARESMRRRLADRSLRDLLAA